MATLTCLTENAQLLTMLIHSFRIHLECIYITVNKIARAGESEDYLHIIHGEACAGYNQNIVASATGSRLLVSRGSVRIQC